jgi:hypothetical protein
MLAGLPPLVQRTIEYLNQRGLDEPGIYRESASAGQLKDLKDQFAKGGKKKRSTFLLSFIC